MALALAEHGADLMLADRNEGGLARTAEKIAQFGRRAMSTCCNVSQPDQIRPMFAQLDREFGRIDFLGNVAGDGILGRPEDLSVDESSRCCKTWSSAASACARKPAGGCWLVAGVAS